MPDAEATAPPPDEPVIGCDDEHCPVVAADRQSRGETVTPDPTLSACIAVIRRYRDGWAPMPFGRGAVWWCREGPTEDRPDNVRSWEPITPAERAVIEEIDRG